MDVHSCMSQPRTYINLSCAKQSKGGSVLSVLLVVVAVTKPSFARACFCMVAEQLPRPTAGKIASTSR